MALLLGPIASHSFFVKALGRLYQVKSESKSLFKSEKNTINNQPIKFTTWNAIRLYFTGKFSCLASRASTETRRLQRMFERGSEKLNNELSIERILRLLRDVEFLLREDLINNINVLDYNENGIIDIDSSSQEKEDIEGSQEINSEPITNRRKTVTMKPKIKRSISPNSIS